MNKKSIHAPAMACALLAAGAAVLVLPGCGGGGSDAGPAASSTSLSGVAATGSPLAGATVTVRDRDGTSICTTTASDTGAYSCTLPSTAVAPFVVTASLGDITLFSATASSTSATVNVTPITNLIAARLSTNGDPARLASSTTTLTTAAIAAKVTEVTTALQPLLTAAGDSTDPISGSFTANGSTHDKVLDALQVNVRPVADANGTVVSSNVDITVKTRPASNAADPVQVSFNTSATSVPAVPSAVSMSTLATGNVPALMQDLMTRLAACYALPVAQRVTGSTVAATACRTLFSNNDPTSYRNNGETVGPTGAFSGLFSAQGDGTSFDRATFDFLRTNGDVVLSYRWTNPAGSTDTARVVVAQEGGVYKLIGNQNVYSGRVEAFVQKRDFLRYGDYSYHSTGYNVLIANLLDGQGNPLFDHVTVTTPGNEVFTYRPGVGQGHLQLQRGTGPNTFVTSVMRVAAAYIGTRAGNPSQHEINLAFPTTQWTDAKIAAIPDQGVWRFDYQHANPATPVRTEYYRTSSRAPTLAEVRALGFATPLPAARADLLARIPLGYLPFNTVPTSTSPNVLALNVAGGAWWTVPQGALAPVSVTVFGTVTGSNVRFDDRVAVSSTARSATILCSRQSTADTHCDAVQQSSFAAGTYLHSIELTSRSQEQLQISSMLATYNPTNQVAP